LWSWPSTATAAPAMVMSLPAPPTAMCTPGATMAWASWAPAIPPGRATPSGCWRVTAPTGMWWTPTASAMSRRTPPPPMRTA